MIISTKLTGPTPNLFDQMTKAANLGINTIELDGFTNAENSCAIRLGCQLGIRYWKYSTETPTVEDLHNIRINNLGYSRTWANRISKELRADHLNVFNLALLEYTGARPTFTAQFNYIKNNPGNLHKFRNWLECRGLTPTFLGHFSWATVQPITVDLSTVEKRRLSFWSAYYIQYSIIETYNHNRIAIEELNPLIQINTDMGQYTQWNRLMDGGSFNSTILTENYTKSLSYYYSLAADKVRSAAKDAWFGASIGNNDGALLKTATLVGKGANIINFDSINNNETQITDAINFIVGNKDLLQYSSRKPPKIALLLPNIAELWSAQPLYYSELEGIYHALIHSGYTVDFLDETDITNNRFNQYDCLYITTPNLSLPHQYKIINWIRAGGWVTFGPGACVNDEYNTYTNAMNAIKGLPSNYALQSLQNTTQILPLTTNNTFFGFSSISLNNNTSFYPLIAPVANYINIGNVSGVPAILYNNYGCGGSLHYSHYIANQYNNSILSAANSNTNYNYSTNQNLRNLLCYIPNKLNIKKETISSNIQFDVFRLDSFKGILLTTLNRNIHTSVSGSLNIILDSNKTPNTIKQYPNNNTLPFTYSNNTITINNITPTTYTDTIKIYFN